MARMTEKQIREANAGMRFAQPSFKDVPPWNPLKDRAYRNMLEKIQADKVTLSLGRKQYE